MTQFYKLIKIDGWMHNDDNTLLEKIKEIYEKYK